MKKNNIFFATFLISLWYLFTALYTAYILVLPNPSYFQLFFGLFMCASSFCFAALKLNPTLDHALNKIASGDSNPNPSLSEDSTLKIKAQVGVINRAVKNAVRTDPDLRYDEAMRDFKIVLVRKALEQQILEKLDLDQQALEKQQPTQKTSKPRQRYSNRHHKP